MADPREFSNKEFQKEFKETVSVLKDTMVGLSASMGEAMSNAMSQSTDAVEKRAIGLVKNDLASAFRLVGTEVDKINDTNNKFVKGLGTVAQLQKKRAEIEVKFEKLDRARNEALKYGVELSAEQEDNYNKAAEAVQVFTKKQEDAAEALTTKLGGLVGLMDRITNIPIVGQLLNAGAASAAMKEELIESGNSIAAFGKGISAAFEGIEKSTVILAVINAAVKVFRFFKDLAFGVSEQITDLATGLGTSMETARGLKEQFFDIQSNTEGTYINVRSLITASGQLREQFGYIRDNSQDILTSQVFLTDMVKASAEQASHLNLLFKTTGQNATIATEEMNRMVISMQEADGIGVDLRTVIEDIASAGSETASYFGYSTTALTRAVIEARKLGLNISQAKQVAGGLLDFESSIQSQLELSVLTQKNFNFGQAMALSATGDIVGATKEVMKQMSQLTLEQRKSPVILNAAAKAAGISTEELARQYALQTDINAQKQEYGRILASEGLVAARTYLTKKGIDQAEVKEIENRISASERFNKALEAAKDSFATLVSGGMLDRLMVVLERFVEFLEKKFGLSTSDTVKTLNTLEGSADATIAAKAKELKPKVEAAEQAAASEMRMQMASARIGPGAGMMSPKQIEMYDARMNEQRKLRETVEKLAKTMEQKETSINIDSKKVSSALSSKQTKLIPAYNN